MPRDGASTHRLFSRPLALLAVQAVALWPHWTWYVRRMTDRSDEPWGVLALVTVGALVGREWTRLVGQPAPARVLLAALATLLAAAAGLVLPPLLAAGVAMLAVALLLRAVLPGDRPRGALMLLLFLSLPLTASLEFFAGYPLRWGTAAGAAALLRLIGVPATAQGAAITWETTTVLVDAPCAGIAMLWVGTYVAALLSYLQRSPARRCAGNIAAALVIVLAANVLRNTLLFFPEAGIVRWPAWWHDAIGLTVFALAVWPICGLVAWRAHVRRTL